MSNIFTLIIVAVSLSMDTFSLSIAYGMFDLKSKVIKIVSICVGIFHFFMPIIGNCLGSYFLDKIYFNANIIIGIVFLCLSIQIFTSLFKKEQIEPLNNLLSILVFSFTVSLDSFSVGLGLKAITESYFLAAFIFMIISAIFTYIGLKMGKKLNSLIKKKAQVLGIILLLLLSITYILKGC